MTTLAQMLMVPSLEKAFSHIASFKDGPGNWWQVKSANQSIPHNKFITKRRPPTCHIALPAPKPGPLPPPGNTDMPTHFEKP